MQNRSPFVFRAGPSPARASHAVAERSPPVPMSVDDYLNLPAVPADHRRSYGSHPEQFGDLYLPVAPGPHPVALLLHGGCWESRYGLAPLGSLCAALAGEGLAVWSLEYRRLGGGGGWPATFLDVAAGADFLASLASAHTLDLTRVIAIGHSAGGHLAAWLAGRHRLPSASVLASPAPLPLRGVVALAGITDLAEGVRRNLCGGACSELVGGRPVRVPERYALGSPAELAPLGVPQRHVVGLSDTLVPADYVRECVERARHQDDVQLETLPGVGHFELVVPSGPAWDAVRGAVLALAA